MNLTDRIATAYDELAEYDMAWVRIARIQAKVQAPAADIAAILIDMAKAGVADLAPESNTKVLTDADHAAAVQWGSEPLHLVAIDPSYWS